MRRLLILGWLAGAIVCAQSTVPFVGCKADGQAGPREAPKGEDPRLPIPPAAARRVAYYTALGLSVLAPRGWYCFAFYGSGGTHLLVSPQPISAGEGDLPGAAVVMHAMWGGTSGRFGVAAVIARVFPAYEAFVNKVVTEGILDAPPSFPHGPYPGDKLAYKSPSIVEYTTPGDTDGLGLQESWLQRNAQPVRGVAMLVGEGTDLLLLSTRLPAELDDLTPIIIQQVERDAARAK